MDRDWCDATSSCDAVAESGCCGEERVEMKGKGLNLLIQYIPSLTYRHEIWVMTKRTKSWIHLADELEEVCMYDQEIWTALLKLFPPWPNPGQADENGWRTVQRTWCFRDNRIVFFFIENFQLSSIRMFTMSAYELNYHA